MHSNDLTIRQQYPPMGHTQLTLRAAGLEVDEKRFFNRTEIEIPYEELLPISVGRLHTFPFRLTLAAVFVAFGCFKAGYTAVMQPDQRESALWLLLILGGLLLAVIAFALRLWRHDFILSTGRGNIFLFDSRRNRAALHTFADTLRNHTTQYLRQQYADVNPLLPAEPQLARLEWLHGMGALSDAQFQQLKTRLLGRFYGSDDVPGNGQGLAPSVN
ncbi:hypothetical protein [Hymenobacter actinosclerus]|uniref:Uncharacterized protein n=1 Tax=Hymenobacter actinosclerus TaxID=82805 RepID=A0A1I0F5J1_9BACT|nr:hypothetical protein [Hymenobacter actinosclerus]SET52495.1 hypothetical protein SAMN04487998_2107 [Hymenobacter actinosclerus]